MRDSVHFVIPARCGSSLKDKNWRKFRGEELLPLACRKCRAVAWHLPLAVLTDSRQYAEHLGWEHVPYVDSRHADTDDVTLALRRYVRWVGSENLWLVMVQCTSPLLKVESIQRALEWAQRPERRADEVLMSVVPWEHKVTALHVLRQEGELEQVGAHLPEPSIPRQALPPGFVFTGGVTVVHASRVAQCAGSLFAGCVRVPLVLDASEALDIDRAEDFDK